MIWSHQLFDFSKWLKNLPVVPSTTEKAADGVAENLIKIHFHWRQNLLSPAESRMLSPVVSEEWCLPVGEFWSCKQDPFFSPGVVNAQMTESTSHLCFYVTFLGVFFSSIVITCQQPWYYFCGNRKEKYLNFSKKKYLIAICVHMICCLQKI